jgi:hypothetical protein
LLLSAAKAITDSLDVLRSKGTLRDALDRVMSFDDFGRLVDLESHYDLDARYRT